MLTRSSLTDLSARVPSRRVTTGVLLLLSGLMAAHPAAAPPIAGVAAGSVAGSIDGLVRLSAAPGRVVQSGAYPTRRVTNPAPAGPEMANVVVFVKGAPPREPISVSRATVMQKGESFVPRVLAITAGSTVEFPNFDPYFHNVFSLSRAASFDLGRFPRGDSRARKFTNPGLVKVYCQIHSHMTASIMVFDHEYFRIPKPDGSFAIDAVPAGTYQISAWHERIGESVRQVRVDAGGRAHVEFSLPVNDR